MELRSIENLSFRDSGFRSMSPQYSCMYNFRNTDTRKRRFEHTDIPAKRKEWKKKRTSSNYSMEVTVENNALDTSHWKSLPSKRKKAMMQNKENKCKKKVSTTPPRDGGSELTDDMCTPLQPSPGFFSKLSDSISKQNGSRKMECTGDIIRCISESGMTMVLRNIFQRLSKQDVQNFMTICSDWRKIAEVFFNIEHISESNAVVDSRKRSWNKENDKKNLDERDSPLKRRRSARIAARQSRTDPFAPTEITNKMNCAGSKKFEQPIKRGRKRKEEPIKSLLKPKWPDRAYVLRTCPICHRKALCDLTYHKGICPYRSCGIEFCTMCKFTYHPLISCIEHINSSKNDNLK